MHISRRILDFKLPLSQVVSDLAVKILTLNSRGVKGLSVCSLHVLCLHTFSLKTWTLGHIKVSAI